MVTNRNFPTGSQVFPDYIEGNAIYVDKTQFIVPLLEKRTNAQYFLSRPRRFEICLLNFLSKAQKKRMHKAMWR